MDAHGVDALKSVPLNLFLLAFTFRVSDILQTIEHFFVLRSGLNVRVDLVSLFDKQQVLGRPDGSESVGNNQDGKVIFRSLVFNLLDGVLDLLLALRV